MKGTAILFNLRKKFLKYMQQNEIQRHYIYETGQWKGLRKVQGEHMEQELQLVRRAQSGDTGAFAQLYEGVYQDLYRFALYVLKHPQDAQDVVSDTVMDAFAQIGELRKTEAFRAWIFRILSNKCKRKLKEYATRPEELTPELLEHLGKSGMDEHAAVRSLFFELPSEERMIIAMHLFCGYSSKEIGKLLDLNENTVRSKESRGIKKMVEKYWK